MRTLVNNGLLAIFAATLSCAATPHSVPTAPNPSVAVPAANSLHPGGEVADASTTLSPADEQDAVSTPAVSLDQVVAAVPPAAVQSPALAPALPAGHYELRSRRVGIGRWQNYQVWVPNQQPVRYQYGGGCSSGRCGR